MPYRHCSFRRVFALTRWMVPTVFAVLTLIASAANGEVTTQNVDYQHDGTALQGYLVSANDTFPEPRGAVLVVHEWWGLNEYAKRRARQLARTGYVTFALDMYGKGKQTDDPKQAGQWAGALYEDRELLRARAQAGLDAFRRAAELGDMPVAAIGYCFGGTTVADLAWSGADLAGIVSFHGNPKPAMNAQDLEQIQAKVLICHGAADGNVPREAMNAYTDSLDKADADWIKITYADAKHAFTNPDASESENVGYNETAARRSLVHMRLFLGEIFGG